MAPDDAAENSPTTDNPRKRNLDDAGAGSATDEGARSGTDTEYGAQETPSKRPRRSSAGANTALTNGTGTNGNIEDIDTVDAMPAEPEPPKVTPRKRGRPPKSATSTPKSAIKPVAADVFTTPIKNKGIDALTPRKQAADRSARKKSARALIEHVVGDGKSDDELEDDSLVRAIYGDSEVDDDDDDADRDEPLDRPVSTQDSGAQSGPELEDGPTTPSKTTARRGRPRRAKSPTPPRDLPPHEQYFFQNKPGRPQTSNNTLSSLALLTHEEYFNVLASYDDPHAPYMEDLESLHAESFPQWVFELTEGFNVCLYGLGSKRSLLLKFAKYLSARARTRGNKTKTVIVNGYAPTTSIREVLSVIGTAVDPSQRIPIAQPSTMLHQIMSLLSSAPVAHPLILAVNSIDAPPLRKPAAQAALAQLAAHPLIHLACTADSPDFPLLWDIGVRSAFNFVFHDATTLCPLAVELDVVDDVHELLGRTSHRVNGREGVAFVLKSLPDNAKNLFRLLVGEVLVAAEEEGAAGSDDATGVEYRMVYNKAVEEFICTSEMAFRTLLKEFHDHQMITSHKDALGTELLSVPFRKEELEAIFEDLMS